MALKWRFQVRKSENPNVRWYVLDIVTGRIKRARLSSRAAARLEARGRNLHYWLSPTNEVQ